MRSARVGELTLALLILLPLAASGHLAPPGADPTAMLYWLARVTGVLALTLILLAAILSFRIPGLDRWFGGLTRLWSIHHVLGWAGFVLVLSHVWLVAAGGLTTSVAAATHRLFPPLDHGAIWAGWAALLALLVFLAPTFKFFGEPGYARWKRLHLISAAALVLALVHALALAAVAWPWWLFGALALAAILWRKLLSPRMAGRYRVEAVDSLGPDLVELQLAPVTGTPMAHQAGQFVYLTPQDPTLASGCGEEHPYTLSSAPGARHLRIGVKALGDATRALQRVRPGSEVRIEGPYGDFLPRHPQPRPVLWVGAGIGITPFVGAVRAMAERGESPHPSVRLVYAVNTRGDAHFADELEALAANLPNLSLAIHERNASGLLDAAWLRDQCPDLERHEVWICGPAPFDRHLRMILRAQGVPRRRIHSEAFHLL
ncbi:MULTISPECIES: ferric reductase-like transmembrane domain-containing protein [unclassified Thioalkalivibrio]|uniref:ferredoxin reductase family protein n=1 Tax=unclassified Thioalkalivibrio TaxID=2621013 RepID=UPI0003710AED|nr:MULTISPECIES: ferric reductase-like transmembrane domain-containing protein [unclassified Thioalkalivibrio]